MKRLFLSLVHRWNCIALFMAEVRHDNAVKIIDESQTEIERAVELAKFTKSEMETAQLRAQRSGYAVLRHDRVRFLGL